MKDGNSAFIDENWNAYSNQWNILWSKPKLSQSFIEEKIKEWHGNSDDKPWDSVKEFEKNEVNGKMHITLSNGIYVNTSNLSVSIQNKIRKLARISNPIYYKIKVWEFLLLACINIYILVKITIVDIYKFLEVVMIL